MGQHQEGIDDIFVCDICEAIFLRETSIVEHLQAQHKEELLALDAGQLRSSSTIIENNKRDLDEEDTESQQIDAKKPRFDSSFLERQYYVCDTCDDIFLDRKKLESHTKIEHENSSMTLHSKRILTPTKAETKSQVCRLVSPQRQNTGSIFSPNRDPNLLGIRPSTSNQMLSDNYVNKLLFDNKSMNETNVSPKSNSSFKENIASNANQSNGFKVKSTSKDFKKKEENEKSEIKTKNVIERINANAKGDDSESNKIIENSKKDSKKKEGKDQSDPKTKKSIVTKFNPEEHYSKTPKASSSNNSPPQKEFHCQKCSNKTNGYSNARHHFLSHYYAIFKDILPSSAPFACPECNKENRDKITLIRHYAFTHKKFFEMSDVTEETMEKEIRGTSLKV